MVVEREEQEERVRRSPKARIPKRKKERGSCARLIENVLLFPVSGPVFITSIEPCPVVVVRLSRKNLEFPNDFS
ncbi:MAG: hypothetical protein M0Z25_07230 [Nitrospiraceae bacterium]|nr:hypothetical protein [Nitrospiraceae bacterium]